MIVEYATHGSLVKFLRECEEAILCSSSATSMNLPLGKTPLSATSLSNVLDKSHAVLAPTELAVAPLSYDYMNTKGVLYKEDFENFAFQIACGLEFLEDMKVSGMK